MIRLYICINYIITNWSFESFIQGLNCDSNNNNNNNTVNLHPSRCIKSAIIIAIGEYCHYSVYCKVVDHGSGQCPCLSHSITMCTYLHSLCPRALDPMSICKQALAFFSPYKYRVSVATNNNIICTDESANSTSFSLSLLRVFPSFLYLCGHRWNKKRQQRRRRQHQRLPCNNSSSSRMTVFHRWVGTINGP